MRITLLAVAMALFASVLPVSAQAVMQHYQLNIPRQSLDAALKDFAHQTGLQVARFSDTIDGTAMVGPVSGQLSAEQALKSLLGPNGLSFKMVNDRTIAIVRTGSATSKPSDGRALSTSGAAAEPGEGDTGLGSKQPFWSRFRLAQADQGASATPPTVERKIEQTREQKPAQLEEVLVTAQKREEQLQNVPISISVLNGFQLESPTIENSADALSTIPGVAVNQAYLSGGTQVTIRGASVTAGLYAGTSPVAYYIDAMPFGLVKSAIAPDQDVYDLQRIEVLRGPQGTLYGASALNGVVRILTNDADLNSSDYKVRGSDSHTDGGGNNYRADAAANIPLIDGKLAARAVVGYESDSGWIDTPIKSNFNAAELKNFRLKVNGQPTDQLWIGLSYWGSRESYGGPTTGNDQYKNSSIVDQPISTEFDAYDLKLAYSSSGFSISNTASYLKYENNSVFDFTSLITVPFALGTDLGSDVFANEILINSTGDGEWRWSVGSMYRHATENRYNTDTLAAGGFFLVQDSISSSYAVYGEVTRSLLEGRLEATVGLRWFEDNQVQKGETNPAGPLVRDEAAFVKTTPRAVLTWHQTKNLTMYGSFSEGFRSGVLQDVGVPVPPAKADTLYNYELGAKGSLWGGIVNFDTAVYYMNWKDVQESLDVPYQNAYTGAVVNGASASGPGVDVSLIIQPVTGLTFGITGSWNRLENDKAVYSSGTVLFPEGSRLNSSPETTASGSGAYAFALGSSGLRARLWASVNYTSAQNYHVNPGGPIVFVGSGDPIVIGRAGVSIESGSHWTASLFANNVNNERNAIVRPFENPDLTARIRPRTVGFQLEYHFK